MEPHGLTWARMGLHYFIDFMSEASVDWGRIVCAKPASPVSMISHMNGLEAQISSIFRSFQREERCFNCLRSIDTPAFLLWKLQKKGLQLFAQYRQPRFPSLKMFDFGWKMHIFANCYVFQRKKNESIFVCNIDSVIICCWKRLCIWI